MSAHIVPAPSRPHWTGPLDPHARLHEAAWRFSNWSVTARMGVCAALEKRGLCRGYHDVLDVVTLAEVARLTRRELRACYGIGPGTVRFVEGLLDRAGLTFADEAPGYSVEDASTEALLEMLPTRSERGTR
jgi:hypothetical protein